MNEQSITSRENSPRRINLSTESYNFMISPAASLSNKIDLINQTQTFDSDKMNSPKTKMSF